MPIYATRTPAILPDIAQFGTNVYYVDPKGGSYTTLSAALAAITDASNSNEYLIVVTGEVAETAAITAKNHVHVLFLPGASITVTSTSTLNAVNFTSLTNTVWAAVDNAKPHIIRAGALGATGSYGIYTSACTSSVRLTNLNVSNTTTGYGTCHGIFNTSSSPTTTRCIATGGAGGVGCNGISNVNGSAPEMTECEGYGGSGGNSCHGINNQNGSSPLMVRGKYVGGSGGTNCRGVYNTVGSSPRMMGCVTIGGSGGTTCNGIYNNTGSSPQIENCIVFGGGADLKFVSTTVAASSRQEDVLQPTASHPWRITGIAINVTAAAAGSVTLTLRDATGGAGNALSAAEAVDSTGWKYIPITGHRVISAGGYVYVRLSASDATLAYNAYYTYEHSYATCYALYQDTATSTKFENCVFVSNAASAGVYVTDNGDNLSMFLGGTARSGLNDATREKAFVVQSAWSPGQVYNMVLDGGSTNLTAAAGTANGSNTEL